MDYDNDADDVVPGLPDLDSDSTMGRSGRGDAINGDVYNDRRMAGGYQPRRGRGKDIQTSVTMEAYPGEAGTRPGHMSSVQDDWRV